MGITPGHFNNFIKRPFLSHFSNPLSSLRRYPNAFAVPPDFNRLRSPYLFFAIGQGDKAGPSRFTQSGLV